MKAVFDVGASWMISWYNDSDLWMTDSMTGIVIYTTSFYLILAITSRVRCYYYHSQFYNEVRFREVRELVQSCTAYRWQSLNSNAGQSVPRAYNIFTTLLHSKKIYFSGV